MSKKVAIATPFYNQMAAGSGHDTSMAATMFYIGRYTDWDVDFWPWPGDSYVWRARNGLAKKLMESTYDEMVFIDSDEEWMVEGFIKLLSRDVPIVGAGYPAKNQWDSYGCRLYVDENARPQVTEDGLIRAESIPGGFMKIQKTAFMEIQAGRPDDYYIEIEHGKEARYQNFFGHIFEDHRATGEDYSFCARARFAGLPVYVEPDIWIRHYGVVSHEGNYHEYLMRQPGGSNAAPSLPWLPSEWCL
jgi:hypothetical protein